MKKDNLQYIHYLQRLKRIRNELCCQCAEYDSLIYNQSIDIILAIDHSITEIIQEIKKTD